MYDLKKADELYKKHLEKNPNYDHDLVMEWREDMPKQFSRKMHEDEYGCHIFDEEMYNEAISHLTWAGGKGKGAKWDVDTLTKLSGIDFEKVDFFEYDYAFIANMLWSDYCEIFTDTTYYLKMAKMYLTDPDYPGKADERAYKNAIKRIEYYEKY